MHYKLLLSVFLFSSISSMEISRQVILNHDQYGFYVVKNDFPYAVQQYNIDPVIRSMNNEQLLAFFENNCRVSVHQIGEDEYAVKAHIPGFGGGVVGATIGAATGKATVSIIGHGAISIVSSFFGPAAPGVFIGLESVFGTFIESVSFAGGVAGGMIGAVLTGPV